MRLASCRFKRTRTKHCTCHLYSACTDANVQVDTIHCNPYISCSCFSPCLDTPRKAGQGAFFLDVAVGVILPPRRCAGGCRTAHGKTCQLLGAPARMSTRTTYRILFTAVWYKRGPAAVQQTLLRHAVLHRSCPPARGCRGRRSRAAHLGHIHQVDAAARRRAGGRLVSSGLGAAPRRAAEHADRVRALPLPLRGPQPEALRVHVVAAGRAPDDCLLRSRARASRRARCLRCSALARRAAIHAHPHSAHAVLPRGMLDMRHACHCQ